MDCIQQPLAEYQTLSKPWEDNGDPVAVDLSSPDTYVLESGKR